MGGTPGDDEPAAGIRASDAERDATIGRLSAATGDGRLTLEEFSQRMELATAARTRADLDRLVTDLPADVATTTTATAGIAAGSAPAPASWHVSPIGGGSTGRGGWTATSSWSASSAVPGWISARPSWPPPRSR